MLAPSRIHFEDDFLGDELSSQYRTSVDPGNQGRVKIATFDTFGRGVLELACLGPNAIARVHYGAVQSNDGADFRNWMMRGNINYGCRFMLNSSTQLSATIGFTGTNDPDNVLAPIISTNVFPYWRFQARCKANGVQYAQTLDTSFIHAAGQWTTFEIVRDASTGEAILKANGTEISRITNLDAIPSTPMVPEWQLWNVPVGQGWSYPAMWVDWWGAEMDRE